MHKYGRAARGEGRLICALVPAGRMQSDTWLVPGWDAEPGHGYQELHYPSAWHWHLLLHSFLKSVVSGPPDDFSYPHRSVLEGESGERGGTRPSISYD